MFQSVLGEESGSGERIPLEEMAFFLKAKKKKKEKKKKHKTSQLPGKPRASRAAERGSEVAMHLSGKAVCV